MSDFQTKLRQILLGVRDWGPDQAQASITKLVKRELDSLRIPKLDEAGGNRNSPEVSTEFAKGYNAALNDLNQLRAEQLEQLKKGQS